MFIELVESLRCVRPHADTWLVASADRMDGRRIVEGRLGCPLCNAEYPVRAGVVYLQDAPDADGAGAAAPGVAPGEGAGRGDPTAADGRSARPVDPDEVIRAGALLNLLEQGGIVLLDGAWGALAGALFDFVPAQYLVLDPPAWATIAKREGISVVRAGGRVPVAAASLRAAALDDIAARSPAAVAATARALKLGGRLVVPASTALPPDVKELAADERHRVGEATATVSAPVRLGRGRVAPR